MHINPGTIIAGLRSDRPTTVFIGVLQVSRRGGKEGGKV